MECEKCVAGNNTYRMNNWLNGFTHSKVKILSQICLTTDRDTKINIINSFVRLLPIAQIAINYCSISKLFSFFKRAFNVNFVLRRDFKRFHSKVDAITQNGCIRVLISEN